MEPMPINLMDSGLYDNELSSARLLEIPPVVITGEKPTEFLDDGLLASLTGAVQVVPDAALGHVAPYPLATPSGSKVIRKFPGQGSPPQDGNGSGTPPPKKVPGSNREVAGLADDSYFETDVQDFLVRYPNKQLTIFDETVVVACGKPAKPGKPTEHGDQVIKMSALRIQESADEMCASCKGPEFVVHNLDAPVRLAWCYACLKVKKSRTLSTPHVTLPEDESVWNDFEVRVGYDPVYVNPQASMPNAPALLGRARSTASVHHMVTSAGSKTLPEYLPRNWQRAAGGEHFMPTSVAISGDFRLIARITQPSATKKEKNPWRVLRISVVEDESILHEIPLKPTAKVQLVNFSHDGALLLVCFHHGADEVEKPRMIIWSMVTGMEVFRSANGERQNIVACSISQDMTKLFSVVLSDDSQTPSVRFQMDNLHNDPAIQELSNSNMLQLANNSHIAKVDYPRLLHPYTYAREGQGYVSVVLDEALKSSPALEEWLKTNNKRVPTVCSMSGDGTVFAHVFDVDRQAQGGGKKEVLLNEEPMVLSVKQDEYITVRPDNRMVLVWDIERDELVHKFEFEREVTTVYVSDNGTLLVVGMSGKVEGTNNPRDREDAYVIIYSLITRDELWRQGMPLDVDSVTLKKDRLEFVLRRGGGSGPSTTTRYGTATGEVIDVSLRALEGSTAVVGLQVRMTEKVSAKNPEEDDDPSSMTNIKKLAAGVDDDDDDDDDDEDEDEDEQMQDQMATPAPMEVQGSQITSIPRTTSTVNSGQAPPPVLIHNDLRAAGPVTSIGVSNNKKWYALKRGLADQKNASCITVGSIGQKGLNIQLHFALKLSNEDIKARKKIDKKKADGNEEPPSDFVEVSCICISSDGSTVACAVHGTTRIVVLSAVDLSIVWEFDADAVPKHMCIIGETLTVASDNAQANSFDERTIQIAEYSLITRFVGQKFQQKCSGRTVGIADNGQRRIVELEDGTLQIEHLRSARILYSMQDHTQQLMGVSANGDLLIMREKKPRTEGYNELEKIDLSLVSLPNFIAFGPSENTCYNWKNSPDIESVLNPLKDDLWKWILLDQPAKQETGRLSRAASREVLESGNSSTHLRTKGKGAKGVDAMVDGKVARPHEGFGLSSLVAYLTHAKEFGALKAIIDACPVFWANYKYVEPDASGFRHEMGKSYFAHALDSNDRILSQMLLDSVSDVVGDEDGKRTPVMQMPQVTAFIRKALEEQRMVDKVEEFLRELPLIKIDEGASQPVFSRFPDGDVLSAAWAYRDVVAGADPWTMERMEQIREERMQTEGEGRERGYKYVAALPGLLDLDFIQPFVLAKASPGLVDNESMRAAIAVLEADMEQHYFGVACTTEFLVFMIALACYCGYIELCVVVDDTRVESLAKTHLGRLGLVLALVAWSCNVFLIYTEVKQLRHHKTFKTYLKAWTTIPWLSHSCCIMSYIFTITRAGTTAIRGTTAMGGVLLFLTVFVYVRSYRPMSSLVGMLIEIWKDMVLFCVVMLILICSFASGFYSLFGRVTEFDVIEPDEYANIFFGVGDSLVQTFLMSVLGAFNTDLLKSQIEDVDRAALSYMAYFLFFVLAMLVNVVGMNALIAIMGDTYARVADPSLEQAVLDKEIGSVLVDRLRLLPEPEMSIFQRRHRWIHVLSPSEKGSMPVGNAYGGGLITMKKEIKEMLESSSKQINGELREIKDMKEQKPEAAAGRNREEEERWMRQIEEIRKGYKEKQKILEKKHKVREEDLKRMAEYAESGSLSKIAATMDLLFQQIEGIEYYIRTNGVSRPPQAPDFDVSSAHQFRAPDDTVLRTRVARNVSELSQPGISDARAAARDISAPVRTPNRDNSAPLRTPR